MNALLSDEQARGIELVATPLAFGGIGWLLDGWLGTSPWLAVALAAFALVGTVVKMWYGYDAHMRQLESSGRWAKGADRARPATDDVDLWADRGAQA